MSSLSIKKYRNDLPVSFFLYQTQLFRLCKKLLDLAKGCGDHELCLTVHARPAKTLLTFCWTFQELDLIHLHLPMAMSKNMFCLQQPALRYNI